MDEDTVGRFDSAFPDASSGGGRLDGNGAVYRGVQIGPLAQDRWAYRLELDSGPDWKISIEAGHWNVAIPRTAVQHWTDSEAITLEHLTPWGTRLILEKDLPRRLLRPGNGDT